MLREPAQYHVRALHAVATRAGQAQPKPEGATRQHETEQLTSPTSTAAPVIDCCRAREDRLRSREHGPHQPKLCGRVTSKRMLQLETTAAVAHAGGSHQRSCIDPSSLDAGAGRVSTHEVLVGRGQWSRWNAAQPVREISKLSRFNSVQPLLQQLRSSPAPEQGQLAEFVRLSSGGRGSTRAPASTDLRD